MESLSDTKWDVVISGTGLQQSLLALALSRSGKKILHIDPNEYYGEGEAALSLTEVDEWAAKYQSASPEQGVFSHARVTREGEGLSSPRAYSLALGPQIIHTKAELVSQLVSSKAFRQLEFLAVGSFYIFQPDSPESPASLSRIPSTREDVFSNTAIPAKSKRALMKCLKFVLDYDSEAQVAIWKPHAEEPLAGFLESQFKLDPSLQSYVITLTLSLDGNVSVAAGLASIHRHMTSMGLFGPGFAAVYPKWGGLSEVAQVGCRALAVGGAVYMLGTGMKSVEPLDTPDSDQALQVRLSDDTVITTKTLVKSQEKPKPDTHLSRLTAVVTSSMSSVFQVVVEGAPTPAVAVVAFPSGSVSVKDGQVSEHPIYAMIHSSDTGECPSSQSVIYLSTVTSPGSHDILEQALVSLLSATAVEGGPSSSCLLRVYYEQAGANSLVDVDGPVISFPPPKLDLAFNDSIMGLVRSAWEAASKPDEFVDLDGYMDFEDREKMDDDPFE